MKITWSDKNTATVTDFFDGKTLNLRVLNLGPDNKEIEIDENYTIMIAKNHISLMENVDGDQCVVSSTEDDLSISEATRWALETAEYFYCCTVDY